MNTRPCLVLATAALFRRHCKPFLEGVGQRLPLTLLRKKCRWLPGLLYGFMTVLWTQAGVESLTLTEAIPASSWFVAGATNSFDGLGTANADDWVFDAEAGDRISARIETSVGAARPRLRLVNPSGQIIASADGGVTGTAEFHNAAVSAPGSYRVRVYTDHQVSDYRLRVDLTRGPGLETEPNNSTNTANSPPPVFLGGSFQLRAAGTLPVDDASGDWFALGTLDPGNTVLLQLTTGPWSTLVPGDALVALYRSGETNPVTQTTTQTTFTVSQRGDYLARVTASSHQDLMARYLLSIAVTDSVAPAVLDVTLPAQGSVSSDIINAFTVTFSEPMRPSTVTNLSAYSLRQPGPDNTFDTADDVLYPVTLSYAGGTTLSVSLVDGPLQLGPTRFTIAATVTDRAGNPLSPPLSRQFTLERLGSFQVENRSNDTFWGGTSLGVGGVVGADGS
ncbi:Ig-like domain-containing protein, partial [Limisphaera sp. VF-2]|uniref:Ig-like domain-containing protein n=1 Tax=Limisphaera sp. VF-2 TaxID=3400418 RepID=UPI003C1B6545